MKNIDDLFEKDREMYSQTVETFYVSTKDINGVHPAVLPERQNYKFSEYILFKI